MGSRYPQKGSSRISYLRALDVPLAGVRGTDLISKALRLSSRDKYDFVWENFVNFLYLNDCPEININTFVKFLTFLFDEKKLLPNTIASYKCALSLPLSRGFGLDLSSYPFPQLLKACGMRDRLYLDKIQTGLLIKFWIFYHQKDLKILLFWIWHISVFFFSLWQLLTEFLRFIRISGIRSTLFLERI